ncbi:MAG: hypothetical protein DRJ10_18650 [Bacteroidetes bacterium]|nr:MAG: hypothetical protein DRJ10_18650 [Bacteroidota bacterium]
MFEFEACVVLKIKSPDIDFVRFLKEKSTKIIIGMTDLKDKHKEEIGHYGQTRIKKMSSH